MHTFTRSLVSQSLTALATVLALTTGCAANVGSAEESSSSGEAISGALPTTQTSALPADPNWTPGIAADSIVLGIDVNGSPLYACRGAYQGSIQTGKTRAGWGVCDFPYGQFEVTSADYQTLVPSWVHVTDGTIPYLADALAYESNGAKLYVCRGQYLGTTQVGKTRADFGDCDITWGGVEVPLHSYDVLTAAAPLFFVNAAVAQGARPPVTALTAGKDANGLTLYPCYVSYGGGTELGKVRSDWSACVIGWGGREVTVNSAYSVFVPSTGSTTNGNLSQVRPYTAGTDTNGQPLGLCAVPYFGSTQVGKYQIGDGVCSFGYSGQSVGATGTFQYLGYEQIIP